MATETQFSKIKKGEYFRFPGKRKVYVFNGGGPVRGFKYEAENDINSEFTTKKNRIIETGFSF